MSEEHDLPIPVRRAGADYVTPDRLELMEQRLTTLFERKFDQMGAMLDKKTTELQFADHNMSARQDAFRDQLKELVDSIDRRFAVLEKSVDERFLAIKVASDARTQTLWRNIIAPIAVVILIALLGVAFKQVGGF